MNEWNPMIDQEIPTGKQKQNQVEYLQNRRRNDSHVWI
jgi:hypothetical protein